LAADKIMPLGHIRCDSFELKPMAQRLADRFNVPLLHAPGATQPSILPCSSTTADYFLELVDQGLRLMPLIGTLHGPIRCDFEGTFATHRRKYGGGNGQDIAKAVGISGKCKPHVLDLTAGLGRDAFVLATLGCQVTMVERNPVAQELLKDGLARALSNADNRELATILARMKLVALEAKCYLNGNATIPQPDVIYLDPMYPENRKSAKVKKEMQAFKTLIGDDYDADHLLDLALSAARFRVVVKRPRKAPQLGNATPHFSLSGKSTRYDIYALKKLPLEL
jgi:16S rRNA (guanine1516-N2)-methyltransferase